MEIESAGGATVASGHGVGRFTSRRLAAGAIAVWAALGASVAADAAVTAIPAPPATFEALTSATRRVLSEGLAHLRAGRTDEARSAFDRAVQAMLQAPPEVAADPRFRRAFGSLVEDLHVLETQGPSAARVEWEEGSTAEVRSPDVTESPGVSETEIPETETDAAETEATGSPEAPVGVEFLDQLEAVAEKEVADAEIQQTSVEAFGSETLDLPIELNDPVVRAISVYSGKFRKWFSAALSRGQPFIPRIREVFGQHGIPQDLAFLPIVESAFHATATSRARARGMWQFMPATGKLYGLKQDHFVDERADFEKATLAAAQYLKKLYEMFGDWNLALAGYNAGEGKVQRAIRRSGSADFWELTKGRTFRPETKNYVPLIHAAIIMGKSPEAYGIDVSPVEPVASEVVSIRASYPLSVVARCAGASTSDIKALNPQLRRAITPTSAFDLRVPAGVASEASACLASQRAVAYRFHAVKRGETASTIARRYGVSSSSLLAANGLGATSRLRPGADLLIPSATRRVDKLPTPRAESPRAQASRPGSGATHTIRAGDTLYDLANRYGTSVRDLKEMNGLRSSRLSIGQVLLVSDGDGN